MSTITTINASDAISDSRSVINTNFSNLNTDKLETVAETNLDLTDITTGNASSSKHGLLLKLENSGSKYLRDDGTWQIIPVATGDVTGPATNTADYVPQWDGADSKKLKNGIAVADLVSNASTTVAGKIEIAISSEVDTGTDATRAVSPDSLAGSIHGLKEFQIKIVDDSTNLTTGDGKIIFVIPESCNGMNLVKAHAAVSTVSSSGTPEVQIRNVTDSTDMLSTKITIDANEYTSYTAATAPVIDTTKDDVVTADRLAIDVDTAGTGAKGLIVYLAFQTP